MGRNKMPESDAFAAEIGPRISEARKRMFPPMSGKDLAEKVGATASAVWLWENGRQCPTSYFLARMCRALGVSADRLLGLPPENADICGGPT